MRPVTATGLVQPNVQLDQPGPEVILATHPRSPLSYHQLASEVFDDVGQTPPRLGGLEAITRAALDARSIYFFAATYAPTESDLEYFFDWFVRSCAISCPRNDGGGVAAPTCLHM